MVGGNNLKKQVSFDMFSPIFVVWAGIEFLYPITDLTSLLMFRQLLGPIHRKPRLHEVALNEG